MNSPAARGSATDMAFSAEMNTLITQVGPGTAGGDLMRRYWHPVCPAAELKKTPKKRIRLLGESLVLFRDGNGNLGLVPEQCPHRKASLYFGFVEEDGLRCPYHGWKFNAKGECIEQPFEPAESKLKALACRPPYHVKELAGLIFAYIGPAPAPQLPRWEFLVRNDGMRSIVVLPIHHCNWVQGQENSHDPVHTYYLHGQMLIEQKQESWAAAAIAYFHRPIEAYSFALEHTPMWSGIRKVREFGGDRPETEPGHPAVFPNILISPQGRGITMHWRVPMDDTHTYIIWCEFIQNKDGSTVEQADDEIPVTYLSHPLRPDGEYDLTTFPNQDLMAWETQGEIADRPSELLGASDKGVTMFRKLLREQIETVKAGNEPVSVFHDPSLNECIRFSVTSTQAKITEELSPDRPLRWQTVGGGH
jgi:5,5'-dehydrodivanillate O-demethylase oxygenase subunit